MRILIALLAAFLILVVGGFLVFQSTEDDRAADARKTLERGADRFVACYERRSSYEKCETGSEKIAVTLRRRREFSLTSSVELGPTYTIARRGKGKLQRTCQPEGEHCPAGSWSPQP